MLYYISCPFYPILSWSISCYFSITCMLLVLSQYEHLQSWDPNSHCKILWQEDRRRVGVKIQEERKSLDDHLWYCWRVQISAYVVGLTHKKVPCLIHIAILWQRRTSSAHTLEGDLFIRWLCMLWVLTVRLLSLICLPCCFFCQRSHKSHPLWIMLIANSGTMRPFTMTSHATTHNLSTKIMIISGKSKLSPRVKSDTGF